MRFKSLLFFFFTSVYLSLTPSVGLSEDIPVAKVSGIMGKCYVLRGADKLLADKGSPLYNSDQIITSQKSVLKITFADGSESVIKENSSVEVSEYRSVMNGDKVTVKSVLELVKGSARFYFKPRPGGHDAQVKNINGVFGIRGTEFVLDNSQPQTTQLQVIAGQVAAFPARPNKASENLTPNDLKPVLVGKGQALDLSPQKPPAPVRNLAQSEIETLEKNFKVKDEMPPQEAQEGLALPPPSYVPQRKDSPIGAGIQSVSERMQTVPAAERFMILPFGAASITRTSIQCDETALRRLRASAQNWDGVSVTLGRELASCPGIRDEALFWLAYYHRSRGEWHEAQMAWMHGAEQSIPLDSRPVRDRLVEKARNGQTAELDALVQKQDPSIKGDLGVWLTLARAHARWGRWSRSDAYYKQVLTEFTPLAGLIDVKIEWAYTLLLQQRFKEAETAFYEVLENEKLANEQRNSGALGLWLSQEKQIDPEKKRPTLTSKITAMSNKMGFKASEFSLSWNAPWLALRLARYKTQLLETPPQTTNGAYTPVDFNRTQAQSFSILEVSRGQDLSSGFRLDAAIGYFGNEQGQITGQLELQKKLNTTVLPSDMQPQVLVGFEKRPAPYVKEQNAFFALPLASNDSTMGTQDIYAGFRLGEKINYRLSRSSSGDDLSWMQQNLSGLYTLHKNPAHKRELLLKGEFNHLWYSTDPTHDRFFEKGLFITKSQILVQAGALYSERIWKTLSLHAGYESGALWRDATDSNASFHNPSSSPSNSSNPANGSSSDVTKRNKIPFELSQDIQLGLGFELGQWIFSGKLTHKEFSAQNGQQAGSTDVGFLEVIWNYTQAGD